MLTAASAFGQGQVVFANTSTTLLSTNSATGNGPLTGSLQWRIGLYIAPDGTVNPASFTLVAVATNSGISAGRFAYPVSPLVINGNTGEPIAFQIRAWQLSAGTTYENALTGFRGQSAIGRVTPGTTGPTPTLFGPSDYVGQLTTGFALTSGVIPEPSSIALGLLGLGAIALFRRRK